MSKKSGLRKFFAEVLHRRGRNPDIADSPPDQMDSRGSISSSGASAGEPSPSASSKTAREPVLKSTVGMSDSITVGAKVGLEQVTTADKALGTQRHVIRLYPRRISDARPATTSPAEHVGVRCDGCEGHVVGTRYKCMDCADFDLCRDCELKDVHSKHTMVAIRVPKQTAEVLVEPNTTTVNDYDYLFEVLVQRGSSQLWTDALEGTESMAVEMWHRLAVDEMPDLLVEASPEAFHALLFAMPQSVVSLAILTCWAKDSRILAQPTKNRSLSTRYIFAVVMLHTETFAANFERASEMFAKLKTIIQDHDIYKDVYLEATAALLAYRYLKVAGMLARSMTLLAESSPEEISEKLLQRMKFYQASGALLDQATLQDDIWKVLGEGYLGASRPALAMKLHLRARFAGSYADVLSEIQKQIAFDAWSTAADYLKMVKQSVEDTNVTVALTSALAKAQRFSEIEEQLLASVPSERLCVVCQVKLKTVAFNPCGHLCVCTDCADHGFATCPVCREDVTSTIKIFT
ncbi:hypothetical protein BV898_15281 [Hypsibius exemplaris]|uniref:RING-type domain-containing protein n=1 Tax=Hypsibius exemplaris TaxID=2072580 RepID=A0A9X6NAN6_HYPEX|nr:hypothetical protein BV898_15281 [Hypsibius exemplaris]